jgi:hypothetical protein
VSTSTSKASEAVVCMACGRIIAFIVIFCKYHAGGISAMDPGQSEKDD